MAEKKFLLFSPGWYPGYAQSPDGTETYIGAILEPPTWEETIAYACGDSQDSPPRRVADVPSEGNAEAICLAVNMHALLVAALEELAEAGAEAWGEDRPCVKKARAAIKRVKGRAQ